MNCTPCEFGSFSKSAGSASCTKCDKEMSCAVASKNPLLSDDLLTRKKDAGDPYFNERKEESKDGSSDIARVVFIVLCIVLIALVLLIGLIVLIIAFKTKLLNVTKLQSCLKQIDTFSLKHFVKPNDTLINTFSGFGGFLSIVLLVIAITIVIISIIDISNKGNRIETATVVPKEVTAIDQVQGYYSIHLYLHGYGDTKCNASDSFTGLDGAYTIYTTAFANATCLVQFTCANCSLQGSTQRLRFSFAHPFVAASAIYYILTLPYFMPKRSVFTMSERIFPDNTSHVFRGAVDTRISMSLTATLYTTLDTFDYFVFGIFSRLFGAKSIQEYTGYSAIRNPTSKGSTVDAQSFWQSSSDVMVVTFEFSANPTAYLISQQGKQNVLDFASRIFALIAAASGVLALIMATLEKLVHTIEQRRKNSKDKPVENSTDVELKESSDVPPADTSEQK